MQDPVSKEGLHRVVGVTGLTLNITNCVLGAGIFVMPALVGAELGTYAIIAYLICGIMMASVMSSYAVAGSRITSSGGTYAYVEAAFGKYAGFVVNWLFFFAWSALSIAALMHVIADALAVLHPVFGNRLFRAFFFLAMLGILVLINIRGARQGILFIKIISLVKLLPLVLIILFGTGLIRAENLGWPDWPSMKSFGSSTLLLFFAFAGFETSLSVSGEIKNPSKTVPRSILFGGVIILVIYILLQLVVQGVLGSGMAAESTAPLAAVAHRLIGPAGATLVLLATAISCYGNMTSDIMSTPRLLFAGARDGMFPAYLGKVHKKFATPHLALITYAGIIFVFSVAGGFQQLAILATGTILLIYLVVIFAAYRLQKKIPAQQGGAFNLPGGPVIPAIGVLAIGWLMSSLAWKDILSILAFIGGVSLLYLFILLRKKSQHKGPGKGTPLPTS